MLSSPSNPRLNRPSALGTAPFAACLLSLAATLPAAAAPLSYSSSAWASGSIDTSYSSPLLGDVRFTLNGPSDYKSTWNNPPGAQGSGLASASYTIAAGQSSTDPVYNIVTSSGQYGFAYTAQAEADRLLLRTKATAVTVDAAGQAATSPNSQLRSHSQATWSQQFLIDATPARPTGSYGAVLMSFTMDGTMTQPIEGDWNSYAHGNGRLRSTFVDLAGVSFSSEFQISTYSWDPTWTGSRTTFKKLLFQYGTPFTIDLTQWSDAYVNAESDFSHTGYISSLELPYQATLQSGAQQAGLGEASLLYGNVTHSATADDINTNWDFSNNGGGFNPPVPEPSSYALMLAGLAAMGYWLRRRS